MEILAALVGAIIGAVASYILSLYAGNRSERTKILAALRSEIRLNLEVANEVLRRNQGKKFNNYDDWCEIIPFSDAAWQAVTSGGGLSHIEASKTQPLLSTYSKIMAANFTATKIQATEYSPQEGKEYISRVTDAAQSLRTILELLN